MKIMNMRKTILLLTAVVVLMAATVGGTIAYLTTSTSTVENVFEPAEVVPVIEENFNDGQKTNVYVWNDGNVDAYIRAAVIVNWVDAEGNVASTVPQKDVDYVITLPASQNWVAGNDGYYYYNGIIKPSTSKPSEVIADYTTTYLLTECKVKDGVIPPEGYNLYVEVLAQAIQSEGGAVTVGSAGGWTINEAN